MQVWWESRPAGRTQVTGLGSLNRYKTGVEGKNQAGEEKQGVETERWRKENQEITTYNETKMTGP